MAKPMLPARALLSLTRQPVAKLNRAGARFAQAVLSRPGDSDVYRKAAPPVARLGAINAKPKK